MTFSTDDVQTARGQDSIVANLPVGFDLCDLFRGWVFQRGHFCLPATAKHNIGTTTRHVGGDGHG
ncbi:hypothetical protein D3C76_1848220 [compost metagenome]